MNVLNVADLERELRKLAVRSLHLAAERWVMTVARNYFLGKLPQKDVEANFREICLCRYADALKNFKLTEHDPEKYDPPELPDWAFAALNRGETLLWFDSIQCRRREIWHVLEIITLWFNNWKPTDTRLRRLDRIAFPVATQAAVLWYKDVSENIWNYVSDKPVVVRAYDHGYRWVKLVTALQFEREGRLMGHCVGNGTYYSRWHRGEGYEYYSLRDRDNQPHITMEVSFNSSHPVVRKGSIVQCKGKGNAKPAKHYQPYLRQFINDMQWGITGDVMHID